MALCTGGFGETRVGLRSTKLLVVREKKTSGTQRTRAHVGLRGGDVWHFRLSFCSLVYMYNQTLTFSLIFERFSLIWFNKGWLWVLLRDLLIKKWIPIKIESDWIRMRSILFDWFDNEGEIGGYPISQYSKENWQIPKYRVYNRPNTDIAFLVGHA